MTNAISAAEPHKCDNIVARRSEESVTSCWELGVSPPQRLVAFEGAVRTISPAPEMLSMAPAKQRLQSQWEPHREWIPPLSANGTDKKKHFPSSPPQTAGAARSGECDHRLLLSILSRENLRIDVRKPPASSAETEIISRRRTFWITPEAISRWVAEKRMSLDWKSPSSHGWKPRGEGRNRGGRKEGKPT